MCIYTVFFSADLKHKCVCRHKLHSSCHSVMGWSLPKSTSLIKEIWSTSDQL